MQFKTLHSAGARLDVAASSLYLVLIAVPILWLTWFVWHTYVPIVFSDMGSVLLRYDDYMEGRIDLAHYIFMRHGDHFHALIYVLSGIEFRFLSGSFVATRTIGLIASLGTVGLLVSLAWGDPRSRGPKGCAVLVSAIILSGVGWEAYAFSFQAVVTTFRFMFVASVLLACLAAYRRDVLLLAGCAALSSITMFCHGSGIMVPAVVALPFVLVHRYVTATCVFIPLALLYAAAWIAFPGNLPTGAVAGVVLHPILLLAAMSSFLGTGLYIGNEWTIDIIGAAGLVFACASLVDLFMRWRKGDLDWLDAFLSALLIFSCAAAFLAAALHVSYGNYYLLDASRYSPIAALLWASLAVYSARKTLLSLTVTGTFAAAVFVYGVYVAQAADQHFVAAMREASQRIAAGTYDPAWLRFVFPDEDVSRKLIALEHKYHLAPLSE